MLKASRIPPSATCAMTFKALSSYSTPSWPRMYSIRWTMASFEKRLKL